jgi:hypothetical protein
MVRKVVPDSHNVFERFYKGMEAFCCSPDNLRQRLLGAKMQLSYLRVEDFPEHMRIDFNRLMEELPKSETPRFRDKKRRVIAKLLLSLYTKATRLDGMFQDAV